MATKHKPTKAKPCPITPKGIRRTFAVKLHEALVAEGLETPVKAQKFFVDIVKYRARIKAKTRRFKVSIQEVRPQKSKPGKLSHKPRLPVEEVRRYSVPDYIGTENIRGQIEHKFTSIATGRPIMISRGLVFHPNETANLKYEQAYFFRELQLQETYLEAVNTALEPMLLRSKDWFLSQLSIMGWHYQPITLIRWSIYIRHPETNEIRELWDHGGGPLPIGGDGFQRTTPIFDFHYRDFDGLVPDHYWEQGYLVAGIRLYEYTLPQGLRNLPQWVTDKWGKYHAKRQKTPGKKHKAIRAKTPKSKRLCKPRTLRGIRHRGKRKVSR